MELVKQKYYELCEQAILGGDIGTFDLVLQHTIPIEEYIHIAWQESFALAATILKPWNQSCPIIMKEQFLRVSCLRAQLFSKLPLRFK